MIGIIWTIGIVITIKIVQILNNLILIVVIA